jgi:hypothetical protein
MDSEMRPTHYDQLNLAFPNPPKEEEETTMTMTTVELVSEFHVARMPLVLLCSGHYRNNTVLDPYVFGDIV